MRNKKGRPSDGELDRDASMNEIKMFS